MIPVDYAKKVGLKAFADKPVGTGPYMVDSWKHSKSVTLVKNPEYWNADGTSENTATAGYVDEIDFNIYNDVNTEYLAFQKGDLDFSTIPPGNFKAAAEHSRDPRAASGPSRRTRTRACTSSASR